MKTAPHYLLLTGSSQSDPASVPDSKITSNRITQGLHPSGGRWHFVLEPIHHGARIEADEIEPGVIGERLNLLAVVRGIEALEQPAKVTLITPSKFVGRGIRSGIPRWRENNWHWERFGEMKPVKHADLWKRIDHAMQFHKVDCRFWNFNGASSMGSGSQNGDTLSKTLHQMTAGRPSMNNQVHQESVFEDGSHQATENRLARPEQQRRRIVLTNERMNDHLASLDNVEELEARHQKLFKATRKGWTRVTEISDDVTAEDLLPKAFGCSAN